MKRSPVAWKRFHAFESKPGRLLWETKLEYDAITASGGLGITDPNPANNEQIYGFALP